MPCNYFPFHSRTISNDTLQSRPSSLRQHHLTRALPASCLLPTKSHNVVLLQWPLVPDSMLFFNPFQTVKPLASWLPGASNESFIKATVSCVAHLFSHPFQALRALPNCLRMDDLSEGPEEMETSISITRSLWHAEKDTHTYKETNGVHMYVSTAAPAEFRSLSSLPGLGSVFSVSTSRSLASYSFPHRHLGPLCQGSTTIRKTMSPLNKQYFSWRGNKYFWYSANLQ